MATLIDVQTAPIGHDLGDSEVIEVPLLPGAVAGIETTYCAQPKNMRRSLAAQPGKARVLLFFSGEGNVDWGLDFASFSDVAAFAGPAGVTVRATSSTLAYLEIRLDCSEAEVPRAADSFFVRYAECEMYTEAIKSPTTLSRTIIPPGVIPRFCMGSVEVIGPDQVGAHSHPMLEQLFWGLPGNDCVVTADGAEAVFGECVLLHVPLGSRHGVRVREGARLHYVWMDFFRRQEDLTYIQQQHIPTSGKP